MYYNKVEICGVNTSKLKPLTSEEKEELLELSSKGDADARQKLIDGNLRLVLASSSALPIGMKISTICFRSAVSGL